jgi:phosphoglycolate phosphatase-like HAD superfamily hydrolase
MHKIVFDLDGVLRDLVSYICNRYNICQPDIWYWEHEGKDIYKLIREDNYRALLEAGPTEYLKVAINNFDNLEIWTNQPKDWLSHTYKWINKNIKNKINYNIKIMSSKQKEKKLYSEDVYIVEDYPYFDNYDKVILIDRSYNRLVYCKNRVKNSKELINKIKELGGDTRLFKQNAQ